MESKYKPGRGAFVAPVTLVILMLVAVMFRPVAAESPALPAPVPYQPIDAVSLAAVGAALVGRTFEVKSELQWDHPDSRPLFGFNNADVRGIFVDLSALPRNEQDALINNMRSCERQIDARYAQARSTDYDAMDIAKREQCRTFHFRGSVVVKRGDSMPTLAVTAVARQSQSRGQPIRLGTPEQRAIAEDRLKPGDMQQFGGIYSTDCRDIRAPRLVIGPDTVVLERGERRVVVASDIRSVRSPFGQMAPPEGFVVNVLASAADLYVYEDARGLYLSDPGFGEAAETRAIVGNDKRKFRACGQRAALVEPPPPASSVTQPASSGPIGAYELLKRKDAAFTRAYRALLGGNPPDRWLSHFEGPSTASYHQRIGGIDYLVDNVCKPHDCGENNLVIAYDAAGGKVFGALMVAAQPIVIAGNPPAAVRAELPRLWTKAWGGN